MVVDLSSDDARVAIGALKRLGLHCAILVPQGDADQDQKRNRRRRHETKKLRTYSQASRHHNQQIFVSIGNTCWRPSAAN